MKNKDHKDIVCNKAFEHEQKTTNDSTIKNKKCPFCAEKIQAEAIKCPFCGELLNKIESKGVMSGKKKKRLSIILIAILVILLLVGITVDFIKENSAEIYEKLLSLGPKKQISKIDVSIYISPEDKIQKIQKAEAGDVYSQIELGKLYERGTVTDYREMHLSNPNYKEAAKWYSRAADKDYTEAQTRLGVLYFTGRGVTENFKEAYNLWNKAANKGDAEAQYWLGVMYSNGEGVTQDFEKAARWFQKSTEHNVIEARTSLGVLYARGLGVPQDSQKAYKLYTKSAAQGDSEAQYYLGEMYYNGDYIQKDYEKALRWFIKSEAQGHKKAAYFLGLIYYNGKVIAKDYDKANSCFWTVLNTLSFLEEKYSLAGENSLFGKLSPEQIAEIQCLRGIMYAYGKGVKPNGDTALEWYRSAAEQGNAQAQFLISEKYYRGNQNLKQAFDLCYKSASQGYADAQALLGSIYSNGRGVLQDHNEGFKWYHLAAEQGFGPAQNRLGHLYSESKNYIEAYKWFLLARANSKTGYQAEYINKVLKTISDQMTAEQIEEAQRRAKTFVEK